MFLVIIDRVHEMRSFVHLWACLAPFNGAYQDAKFGFGVFFGCAELMKHSQFLSYTAYNPQDLPER